MKKLVYLSGKISGLWYPYAWFKFSTYHILLNFIGYRVWNPIVEVDRKTPYDESLFVCLENLIKCDYVCFQFDWLWSDEAKVEFNVAVKRNKKIILSGLFTRKFFEFLMEKE
jgi:hypothetical protein